MLFDHRVHIAADIRVVGELSGREATAKRHIVAAVAHLADGSKVDRGRRSVLQLVVIAQHQGAGAGIERFAEFQTGQGYDFVLAEGTCIVELATGRPITAVHILGCTETAGRRSKVRHVSVGIDLRIGIVDRLGSLALLRSIPIGGAVVGLIDELCVGGQAFEDLEEQVAVITHILALGVDHIVVVFVHQVDAGFLEVTPFGIVAVLIAVEPGIEQFVGSIRIVEALIGRRHPRAVETVVRIALRTLVAVDAVDGHRGGQPLGDVVGTFVADLHLPVESIDDAGVVIAPVHDEVALEAVGAAAQGQVVLLHQLTAVHRVGILLGEIVLRELVAELVNLTLRPLAGIHPVVGIVDGGNIARTGQ